MIALGTEIAMGRCNHEEADTRLVVHVVHSQQNCNHSIVVHTVDTDVVVIMTAVFHQLKKEFPLADILIAFSVSKNFRYYHINQIAHDLGETTCTALLFFHAFTGCDTYSCFFGKGKKTAWQAWLCFPEATGMM